MNAYKKMNVASISIGIVLAAVTGYVALAAETKEIPDHRGFQSCEACHAEKQDMWDASEHGEAIRRIVKKNPEATDCGGCHSAGPPEARKQGAATDPAPNDGFHEIPCLACHTRESSQYDHRLVMDPEKLCDACHTQRAIFWGKGARSVEDIRNFHSGVSCISCHMTEGNHRMKVLRPDDPGLTGKRLDTCTACHMDNNREARVRQIQEWQGIYEENMDPLLADVEAVEAVLEKTPGLLDPGLKTKFENIRFNLALLENDGSRGFHNFVLLLEITSQASGDMKAIKAAIRGK